MFMGFYQKGMNTYLKKVSKAIYSLDRTNKNETRANHNPSYNI
jgi:hypothetical protein